MPLKPPPAPHDPRLVIASANVGKLREFKSLLAGLPFELVTQGELGVRSVDETGHTFLDNALLKARHAATVTGHAALADDSGIEVDALGSAPGVFSARYAGPGADDAANNAKLLAALAGVPAERRTARYRCALVYLEGPADLAPIVAQATWEGVVLEAARGTGGFGYDPYFFIPTRGLTAAELDPDDKNRLSHRGRALRELRRLLDLRFAAGPVATKPLEPR